MGDKSPNNPCEDQTLYIEEEEYDGKKLNGSANAQNFELMNIEGYNLDKEKQHTQQPQSHSVMSIGIVQTDFTNQHIEQQNIEYESEYDAYDGVNNIQNIVIESGSVSESESNQTSSTQKNISNQYFGDSEDSQTQQYLHFLSEEQQIFDESNEGTQDDLYDNVESQEKQAKLIFDFSLSKYKKFDRKDNDYYIQKLNCDLKLNGTFRNYVIEYFQQIDDDNLYLYGEEEIENNVSSLYQIYEFSMSQNIEENIKALAFFTKQLQENYIHNNENDKGQFIYDYFYEFIYEMDKHQI
ncbi:hypothetical protein ABPG74_007739 [Tetrahymena malaccensis]